MMAVYIRKLKDIAVDLHNTLEKWELFNDKGRSIISEIANAKLEYVFKQKQSDSEQIECKAVVRNVLLNLEPQCKKLQQVLQSMNEIVDKLESLASSTRGIHSFYQHRGDLDSKLGFTWTAQQFVDALDALVNMYARELSLKREISETVALAKTHSSFMFYTAAWIHQPYIDNKFIVKALLLETGLTPM